MKKLFIYYSETGNGDIVAKYLEEKGIDVIPLTPKKRLPKSFFFKIMQGGFLAGLGAKTKLINFNPDLGLYDEIIIGSPIWNDRLSCPVNTLLKMQDLMNKVSRFVLYSGSGHGEHAIKKINKLFGEKKIIELKEPKKYNEELAKLEELA